MAIELLYGKGKIAIDPPPGCVPHVIEKRPMPVLLDPPAAIRDSIANPIGIPPLDLHAKGQRSPCT